jgi:hypothetical protein
MNKPLHSWVASSVLGVVFLCGCFGERQFSVAGQTLQRSKPASQVLFDDFNYTDAAKLARHGWIIRTANGWPGIPGAKWPKENVSLLAGEPRGNRILRMTSSTDGTPAGTSQTQICHQRKYLDGTYAARVRFSDQPVSGPAGDQIVESFYTISPLKAPMDPDYSELDFEYLPNGGWGETGSMIYATSWFTFRLEPWFQDNMSNHLHGSQAGWHTLVTQVGDGKVRYYVDGKLLADHGGKFYPRVLMSINFNLWFIKDGAIKDTAKRQYQEDIDWVFHQAKTVLSPAEVEAAVAAFRKRSVGFKDNVPAPVPALESPCNF